MKNTTLVGDISVAMITGSLMKSGYTVLKPLSDGLRYDLVIEIDGKFERVQCKTGRLNSGSITFNSSSLSHGNTARTYDGEADLFAVYCPETDCSYLIPVPLVAKVKGKLRVDKENSHKSVLFAENYIIHRIRSTKVGQSVANA